MKELLAEKPLVLDREFSYLELMQALVVVNLNFVIRLKLGAHFFDSEGKRVALNVKKGELRILNKVFYMDKVFVSLIGWWHEGVQEPMWIMTNLFAEQGRSFYLQRMKIDESFRDLKNLLGMDKMMFQKRHWMEQMVSLAFMAYAIALVLGETLRAHVFPEASRKRKLFLVSSPSSNSSSPSPIPRVLQGFRPRPAFLSLPHHPCPNSRLDIRD